MNSIKSDHCRDDVREMIPWYVNGTLSASEALQVREHVDVCDECRADAEMHRSMHSAVANSDVSAIIPKTSPADILGADETAHRSSIPNFGSAQRRMAVAAGIAILGIVMLVSLNVDRGMDVTNQQFETATSIESATAIDYVLQLQFSADVSEQQRDGIIAQLDDVVKWTTAANGDYEVHVRLSAPSLVALEAYQLRAESIPGVQSAEFTALQLPVR